MFILQRALLLGLAAASLVTSRATGNAPDHDHILKRGVAEPQGDLRVPEEIVLGSDTWKRADILEAIKNPVNPPKPFGNHGVEWKGNKWVAKKNLFEGVGAKLIEIDLTKNPSVRGKFRAIVTANKNFVGITEHAAENNVKSVWDVKELTREGEWIELGVTGDRVTGTNGLHYARKDIAAAMQSPAKVKVGGKLWKSKISAIGGGSKDVFYVVYEGNEFKHIEDADGAKVFELERALAEKELQKVQEPAEQLLKDSQAARVEAERAASVEDVEAASAKADTALKALQYISQQTIEYIIKYNNWIFIKDNLKPFRLYNQARVNFLLTSLRVDEKTVEDFKIKFDAAVQERVSGNEVITEAEKLAADIKQVVDKVQKDLETKTALKSNPDSTPPLQLGKLARQDVTELKKLEAKALESEVSATEKSLSKLSEIQKQVEAQLEKLPSPPDTDPSDKDKDKGDKDKDKEDKDKNKETDNSNKEPAKGQEGDKEKDTGKETDKEKDTGSKNPGSNPSEQSTEESKKAIQERTKVAQDVEKSSGSSWVGKALGGIAATATTLIGAGGLYLAAAGTAGAGGAAGVGGGALLTGSFAVGELTISAAPISLEVSSAEVAEVLHEVVPEYAEKALNTVSKTLRPAKLPKTPVRIPVLARKRQEAGGGGESPELKRWRVAAVALLANQAIKDSLLEAFNQAQKEISSK